MRILALMILGLMVVGCGQKELALENMSPELLKTGIQWDSDIKLLKLEVEHLKADIKRLQADVKRLEEDDNASSARNKNKQLVKKKS